MSDDANGSRSKVDDARPLRPDADKRREPQFVAGRMGTRMFSLAALLERIEAEFYDEYGEDSPLLREANSEAQRLRLVLDTAEYVLGVESIHLSQDEKAELVRRAHSNLFGYGPLDPLFADERVTTIALESADRAAVRYEHGDLTSVGSLFDDAEHLRHIVARLLMHAGAELRDDQPYIEAGVTVNGRPVCINVVAPPAALALSADIRVHPRTPPTLDELVMRGFLTEEGADVLRLLAASPYGIIIVGESESGKTTLLSALAKLLPNPGGVLSVERAGELRLPPGASRLAARWRVGEMPGVSFGQQIGAALAQSPACLLLDEVRADAPETVAPLLSQPDAPRQLWTFRGAPDAKRLQSALGMLARRADTTQGEAPVHTLYERLPFVITVARIRERLQLFSIAEWQPNRTSDYPDYALLMQYRDGQAQRTGREIYRKV